ncbi:hypothetical protein [Blackfly microvirus SF02]|uniref:Uncharacterized protein n=1 Tax=Blackfly microvirus SF02 TaxID=2576452 RepID=A0A4P8PLL4_9VIRU|nr:hypothetical protein [Blackfly microvirus SF02]
MSPILIIFQIFTSLTNLSPIPSPSESCSASPRIHSIHGNQSIFVPPSTFLTVDYHSQNFVLFSLCPVVSGHS